MLALFQLVIATLEAVGEACGRMKPKTPAEIERQRVLRRNQRAMAFFSLFGLGLCVILLLIMAFRLKTMD
jgi:hypothetical protein